MNTPLDIIRNPRSSEHDVRTAFIQVMLSAVESGETNAYWLLEEMAERHQLANDIKEVIALDYPDTNWRLESPQGGRPVLKIGNFQLNIVDRIEQIRGTDLSVYGISQYYRP